MHKERLFCASICKEVLSPLKVGIRFIDFVWVRPITSAIKQLYCMYSFYGQFSNQKGILNVVQNRKQIHPRCRHHILDAKFVWRKQLFLCTPEVFHENKHKNKSLHFRWLKMARDQRIINAVNDSSVILDGEKEFFFLNKCKGKEVKQ